MNGTHYVGHDKFHRAFNAAVYVAFCCQMNDVCNLVAFKNALERCCIANIGSFKTIAGRLVDVLEVFEVARIGEFIEVHYQVVGVVVDQAAYDMRANKAGAAGY